MAGPVWTHRPLSPICSSGGDVEMEEAAKQEVLAAETESGLGGECVGVSTGGPPRSHHLQETQRL